MKLLHLCSYYFLARLGMICTLTKHLRIYSFNMQHIRLQVELLLSRQFTKGVCTIITHKLAI
jgi:hypothetical protein